MLKINVRLKSGFVLQNLLVEYTDDFYVLISMLSAGAIGIMAIEPANNNAKVFIPFSKIEVIEETSELD